MNKALAIRFLDYMREYSDDPVMRMMIVTGLARDEIEREEFYRDYVYNDTFQLGLTTLRV